MGTAPTAPLPTLHPSQTPGRFPVSTLRFGNAGSRRLECLWRKLCRVLVGPLDKKDKVQPSAPLPNPNSRNVMMKQLPAPGVEGRRGAVSEKRQDCHVPGGFVATWRCVALHKPQSLCDLRVHHH